MKKAKKWIVIGLAGLALALPIAAQAEEEDAEAADAEAALVDKPTLVDIPTPPVHYVEGIQEPTSFPTVGTIGISSIEPVRYTLGPEDAIAIEVRRHPEFSGAYMINSEGKIQYKYVGDVYVNGLTKTEVKDKITQVLSAYLVDPSVEVTIAEYRSKVFYVIGEVGRPGKYYMMADEIPIREAAIQAGLPQLSASAKKARLITPDKHGKPKAKKIDLEKILYEGDLRENVMMRPGDVLYVPATLITKFMRKIAPVAQPVQSAVSAQDSFYRIGNPPNYNR